MSTTVPRTKVINDIIIKTCATANQPDLLSVKGKSGNLNQDNMLEKYFYYFVFPSFSTKCKIYI